MDVFVQRSLRAGRLVMTRGRFLLLLRVSIFTSPKFVALYQLE
jgi:hypothetical protein